MISDDHQASVLEFRDLGKINEEHALGIFPNCHGLGGLGCGLALFGATGLGWAGRWRVPGQCIPRPQTP